MTCPIWIARYRPKYLNSKIIRIASTTTGLVNIVKRVNLLLIWLKKQGSECVLITDILEKIFGKNLKLLHKFSDIADEFIKLFSS